MLKNSKYEQALEKAREEFSKACHYEDCGSNPGIRKMNANKADWLKWVIYLAERGLECEKLMNEPAAAINKEEQKTDYQKVIEFFQSIKNNF